MATKIKITPNVPSQSFSSDMNGDVYSMNVKWNSRASFFTMDIYGSDDNAIIIGMALITGSDLLAQFNFGIGGLFCIDTTSGGKEMTLENAGIDVSLYYYTPEELDASV